MAVKEAQKSQVAHAGIPHALEVLFPPFYSSGCINSNGWSEGNLSRLYHVCDITKSSLKPALEAVSGPEWCKCLVLLPPAKVWIPQCGRICLCFELRWWGVNVDLAAQNITHWSLDVPTESTFFFPQDNSPFYLYHSLERFVTNVCADSVLLCKKQCLEQEEKIIHDRISHIFLGA